MPDEALQLSLQGRPRQAPDFSPLALAHLHTNCLAVRQLIKRYLSEETQLDALIVAVQDIHHTLQLLDRQGAKLVTSELILLLRAMAERKVDDVEACAHTLVFAGERLADYVAHLQKPGAIDSALPLLPVINNCRACRGEDLLSEMLVVASGIDLPDASTLALPNDAQINAFVTQINASRQPLLNGLLGWFTDNEKRQESLSQLSDVFAKLASSCDNPTALQPLVPLFESAEFICQSVSQNALDNSAALQQLFAQIERMLDGFAKLPKTDNAAFAKPVSERLYLNLLYYVALSDASSPKAVALRRRFRLDRFIPKGMASDRSNVSFEGVGDRLADSIRDAIELETEAARAWLSDDNSVVGDNDRVRRRLAQLEPAILLLGAQESMRHMTLINQSFAELDSAEPSSLPRIKEHLADSLVRLERSLDTELNAIRARTSPASRTDLESILSACLAEAELRLLSVEEDLIVLFAPLAAKSDSLVTQTTSTATVTDVCKKLTTIDSALQVLPLPEVSPLIGGIKTFITSHENQVLTHSAHRDLATVMVSLGYYLNSVLQPNGAAGQLLLEAEEALLNLNIDELKANDDTLDDTSFAMTAALGYNRKSPDTQYDTTLAEQTLDTEAESFIGVALAQMSIISANLPGYEKAVNANDEHQQILLKDQLIAAYDLLSSEAHAFNAVELKALADANVKLLSSESEKQYSHALLEESVAVLPQLVNQMQSSSDKVYGLQDLLDRLNDAGSDDLTLALDIEGILKQNSFGDEADTWLGTASTAFESTLIETNALDATELEASRFEATELEATESEGVKTAVSLDSSLEHDVTVSLDDEPVMTLDNTLEQVFFRECDQHMLSLQKAVADALSSKTWENDARRAALLRDVQKAGVNMPDINPLVALPNRDMLRALHTLTGSAQTVAATSVIAIVQPLQKAALHKQRSGESFNRVETEYIGELLEILNERLEAMEADIPFSDDDVAVMTRLNDFVSRCEPWVPERKSGLELGTQVGAIESVFEEEARELLETLRHQELRLSDNDQRDEAVDRIFSCLHTIKGSARMAGQVSLADRAHALEDELRLADGVAFDGAVQRGLGELQTLMLVGYKASQRQLQDVASTQTANVSPSVSAGADLNPIAEINVQPMGLTEASFNNMSSLATRATVSQAKLSESMLHLQEACRDIENTSTRLQALPHDHTDLNSTAIAEMLSDLESARRMLADALLDAEAENTQASRATSALHQTLIRAQLVSFDEAQIRLQHTLKDAASETDKNVALVLTGAELNIDKTTFRKIMTPLEHLVRNAVVHGIESSAERIASGKSEQALVSVDAKIDGTDLLISISDDGAGIDTGAINAKRKASDEALLNSDDTLLETLCEPGFTTNAEADQFAGRGLGLASVKQSCEELDGSLQLNTVPGDGTTFTLRLPQKIRINQVVLVEHNGMCYAIPVNFVHTVSEEQFDLSCADIQYNNEDYTCCSLDAVLNREISSASTSAARQVVLIGVHDQHIALLVDNVLGYREIIAQPLGAQLSALKRYLGGSVLANGSPVLIPDFNRLLNPDHRLPLPQWSAANEPVIAKTALIVDDSITMRIAAEQMLHNMGIKPSMARDGAEAIELVADALPDVLLVDIDMPRVNGFDFLRHLNVAHPGRRVPVIMISTRDTNADRNEARELGAADYLLKPYTEQQLQNCLAALGVVSG